MTSTAESRLHEALDTYRSTFGHAVPAEVTTMFSRHPGPLLVEIRQAIALGRAVPAWEKLSRVTDPSVVRYHAAPQDSRTAAVRNAG